MTRAQLRAFLRSRLADKHPTNPRFSDSDLNLSLLDSAKIIQNWVALVDPNPVYDIVFGDFTANERDYLLPGGYRSPGVREVAILTSGAAGTGVYTSIEKMDPNELNRGPLAVRADESVNTDTTQAYCIIGNKIRFKIAPTQSVFGGYRMEHATDVSFGDDTSIIQLPLALHSCVYLHSAYMLSPDLGDTNPERHLKAAENIYKIWADAFRLTIGVDVARITRVGDRVKDSWIRE